MGNFLGSCHLPGWGNLGSNSNTEVNFLMIFAETDSTLAYFRICVFDGKFILDYAFAW